MEPDQHSKKRMLEDALDFVLKSGEQKVREHNFNAFRYGSPRSPKGYDKIPEGSLQKQANQEQKLIDLLKTFKDNILANGDVNKYL